jgi:hypothetical protein
LIERYWWYFKADFRSSERNQDQSHPVMVRIDWYERAEQSEHKVTAGALLIEATAPSSSPKQINQVSRDDHSERRASTIDIVA